MSDKDLANRMMGSVPTTSGAMTTCADLDMAQAQAAWRLRNAAQGNAMVSAQTQLHAPPPRVAIVITVHNGGYLVDIGGVTTVCTDLETIHQLVSSAVGAAVLANARVERPGEAERSDGFDRSARTTGCTSMGDDAK